MIKKIRIGVDPGKSGFISWFEDDKLFSRPIPKIKKEFDERELALFLLDLSDKSKDVHGVLEAVNADPKWGAKNNFSFGEASMMFKALLAAFGIPYTRIQPKQWQGEMHRGVPVLKKPSSTGKTEVKDNKAMSEIAAKRLFPEVDFRTNPKSTRSFKMDDNKIDSILIAEYCRRNF